MCNGSVQANANGSVPRSVADALRMACAGLDYLTSPAAGYLQASAIGDVLIKLGGLQAQFTVARAGFLRRFDAADAHDGDGYGSPAAWLVAKTQMSRKDARADVRQMRLLDAHPGIAAAMGARKISQSAAFEITDLTKKLPKELRDQTGKILLDAAVAGAGIDDLKLIAAAAFAQWQAQHPDPDDDGNFDDRFVQVTPTFDGAAIIRGNLTPECAAAVQAVLDALGKRHGPEDTRTEAQRYHDALQLGCELLLRARMVPDRAGADTQVLVQILLGQLRAWPGAAELEQAWLAEPGTLTGPDAEAAACDAMIVPVVTAHADMTIIDQIIELALASDDTPDKEKSKPLSPEAWAALRHAIARLAIEFLSGPGGLASVLRTGLLDRPYATPSLPLDIGFSQTIPAHIRRAVLLRDKACAWPHCGRPAAHCDVHHLRHKSDGGITSVSECVLLCQFHHDICIHRWGWRLVLHPDGTTTAYSPRGKVLHSHSPPTTRAG